MQEDDGFEFSRRSLIRTGGVLAGAGLLGTGTGLAREATGPNGKRYETTKGATTPKYDLGEPYHVYVPTEYEGPDGTTESPNLYAEVIRPVDPDTGEFVEDVPVIMTYSPYNDLRSANRQAPDALEASGYDPTSGESPEEDLQSDSTAHDPTAEYFVQRGYARVMVDLVGTRNSEGTYDYGGVRERKTGRDLVEWFADREWSNGKIGMIGGSYDGTTQWAAAVEQPDGLATIVPQVAIDRWYDYAFIGGVRTTPAVGTPFLFDFGFGLAPPLDADPEAAQATVDRIQPGDRVENERETLRHETVYDAFWDERDYKQRADRIECSALVTAGWLDYNVKHWDSTIMYQALPDDHPKKLVMGQWGHATSQLSDALDIRHAWFDRWLKGIETGVMKLPSVDSQVNTGERFQHEEFPPKRNREVALPLVRSDPEAGELELLGTDRPVYEDTVQTQSEADMYGVEGSGEAHLKFETAPLSEAVRITGTPIVDLLATVSDTSAHFTPVLYHRKPDGSTGHIARGVLNAKQRNGERENDPVPVGETFRAPVELIDNDYVVPEGHRIGLIVAADNSDSVRRDPDGSGTHEIVLPAPGGSGGSTLRLPITSGFGALNGNATELPTPTVSRSDDGSVFTGGQTNQVTIELDALADASEVRLRDRVPAEWEVVAGDGTTTTDSGATYVEFSPAAAGERRDYLVEAPEAASATNQYTFGPVEFSPDGDEWYTLAGTTETNTVVGTGLPEGPGL
jgi:X-Pro dipeptidyl-peptidase